MLSFSITQAHKDEQEKDWYVVECRVVRCGAGVGESLEEEGVVCED